MSIVESIVESWVARHQRRKALHIRRAAAQLSGLDTALRRHQAECPEWRYNDAECSTCRKRRRRLQAAQHALAQDVEHAGGRRSAVTADTSGEHAPQRVEAYAAAIADCREACVVDLGACREAWRRQGEALVAECTTALQRAYDFILAEAFHPDAAWQAAAQVLIPAPLLPRTWQARLATPWLSVHEMIIWCDKEIHCALIYEVYVLEMARWLRESTAAWPCVPRQAAVVYGVHQWGIDFTDRAALGALAVEAAVARREAQQALYGEGYEDDDEETVSAGEEECNDTSDESGHDEGP